MANYRINRHTILSLGNTNSLFICATGESADEEDVFVDFSPAKSAAVELVDQEIARFKRRRANIRSMKEIATRVVT